MMQVINNMVGNTVEKIREPRTKAITSTIIGIILHKK